MTQGKKKGVVRGNRFKGVVVRKDEGTIFIGPSVEGPDREYVKVLSGKVEHKKPSFA